MDDEKLAREWLDAWGLPSDLWGPLSALIARVRAGEREACDENVRILIRGVAQLLTLTDAHRKADGCMLDAAAIRRRHVDEVAP